MRTNKEDHSMRDEVYQPQPAKSSLSQTTVPTPKHAPAEIAHVPPTCVTLLLMTKTNARLTNRRFPLQQRQSAPPAATPFSITQPVAQSPTQRPLSQITPHRNLRVHRTPADASAVLIASALAARESQAATRAGDGRTLTPQLQAEPRDPPCLNQA